MRSLMRQIKWLWRGVWDSVQYHRRRFWITPREARVDILVSVERVRESLRETEKRLADEERKLWVKIAEVNRVVLTPDYAKDVIHVSVSVDQRLLDSRLERTQVIHHIVMRVEEQLRALGSRNQTTTKNYE